MRRQAWRTALAGVVASGLLAAGCTADEAPQPLSLDGEPAAGTEVRETDEPLVEGAEPEEPVEDRRPPPEVQELYASLPPLEPDPDSPVDEETQAEVLAAHERLYHVTQAAYATAEVDEAVVRAVMVDDLADGFLRTIRDRAEQRLVTRTAGIEFQWIEVLEEDARTVLVRDCSIVPPEAALYDADTDEFRGDEQREAPIPVLNESRYERVEFSSSEPTARWRAVSISSVDASGICDG